MASCCQAPQCSSPPFQATMDQVLAMEVGAEIEVTEDGTLEELPLQLENAKNCLLLEGLEASSSDDEETNAPTTLLPLRPPRPLFSNLPASPFATKSLPLQNIIVPFHQRPPVTMETQVSGAYQCQECCQVFVEEWHYLQHGQEHAEELARRPQLAPPRRKQRCPECGKRFFRQSCFTRHVKWHLRLARAGIHMQRRWGTRPCSLASYICRLPGIRESQVGSVDDPCVSASWESSPGLRKLQDRMQPGRHARHLKGCQIPTVPEAQRTRGGPGMKGPKRSRRYKPTLGQPRPDGMSPTQPVNMEGEGLAAILGSKVGLNPLQPVNGQVGGSALQAAILDGQVGGSTLRTLVINSEEPAAILEGLIGSTPPQPVHLKEEAAILASLVGTSPLHRFQTVVLGAEEPSAILEGQVGISPLHPMPLRTEELLPSLFLEAESGLTATVDTVALCLVPLLPDSQGLVPWGSQMVGELPDEAGDTQPMAFQLTGYLPPLNQQCQLPPGPAKPLTSVRAPLLLHLVPTHPGEPSQVLELEYAPGSGLEVEPWPRDGALQAGEDFIVVELEADTGGREEVVASQPGAGGLAHPLEASRSWRFQCPDCGVGYSQKAQLRSHRRGPGHRLCSCGRPFRGLLHLLRHQLWQLEGTTFLCTACGEALRGRQVLGWHKRRRPGTPCFRCPCGVAFQRLPHYLWHRIRNQAPSLRVYSLTSFLALT
uniref:C2H2-type domain-containing protein n=1 Tax=Pelusios castaneus TaxID=367368 RepID=A0A8C8SCF8_9SAUR